MPIYLKPAQYDPSGPDGRGMNRLRIDFIDPSAQCALKPATYAAVQEVSQTTERAAYGPYEHCTNKGDCQNCPIFNDQHKSRLDKPLHTNEFYIREAAGGGKLADVTGHFPMSMNHFRKGFSSFGYWGQSWKDLVLDKDFYPAKFGRDEHSRWVLMKRVGK